MQTVMSIWRKNMVKERRGDFSISTGVLVFTCIYSKKVHIKHYRWNVCPSFLKKKHGKKKLPNLIAISLQWTTECFKSDCGQNLWKIIFVLQHFFDQKHGEKKTSKSHCNSLDMTHWMFLKRLWTEFMDKNLCFATFFRPKTWWKKTSKSHCNSLDMTHWMFLKRLWTEFMDSNLYFATCVRQT